MKRIVIAVAAAAAVVLTALLGSAGAQSGAPTGTLELVQLERENSSAFVDNPPRRRESPGDVFTVSGPVRDAQGRRIGKANGAFTQTGRNAAHGAATFMLAEGRIVVVGALAGAGANALAIAGGSGAYEDASGTATVTTRRNRTEFGLRFGG